VRLDGLWRRCRCTGIDIDEGIALEFVTDERVAVERVDD
jgi:hypothetical protein